MYLPYYAVSVMQTSSIPSFTASALVRCLLQAVHFFFTVSVSFFPLSAFFCVFSPYRKQNPNTPATISAPLQ
jgi:hypothetical protein